MLIQILGAFLTVVSFSFLLDVPKKLIVYAGITGGVGWGIYLAVLKGAGLPMLFSILCASGVIALISHIFARRRKAPVTIFLVPGILPLVPGASIYRCIYYIIMNDSGLTNYFFMETIQIAGAIALSIFIMDSLFRYLLWLADTCREKLKKHSSENNL